MSNTSDTPRLSPRQSAEFLALSLALLSYPLRQDDAMLNAAALRLTRPEPPRDLDLPLLPPKRYPRPPAALVEAAVRSLAAPPPVPDFTGRKAELDRAVNALNSGRPVLIGGAHGAGKTALLRQIAHDSRLRQKFARVWWLDDAKHAGIVFGLALDAPNVLAAAPDEQAAQARDFLQEARALVIVDHAEAHEITRLLPFTPNLALASDTALPELPDLNPLRLELAGLPPDSAAEWLARLAGQPERGVAQVAARLAAQVDNLPGAIRVVAALLREDGVPPDAISMLLEETAPASRLAALYAASFEALPEAYQQLCAALAATPPGLIRQAQILERFDKPLTGQRAITFLERRGFIEREGESVRVVGPWAQTALATRSGADVPAFEIPARVADQYLNALSGQPAIPVPTHDERLHSEGVALVDEGHDDEAEAKLSEALHLREAGRQKYAAAETLAALARLAYLHGEDAQAARRLEQAAERLHALRDEPGLEIVRVALSRVYRRAGRLDAALSVLGDDALPQDLTAVYRLRGDWASAITVYERWLHSAEQSGDTEARDAARLGLAETLLYADRPADALALVQADDSFVGGWIRALVYHMQGEPARAIELYTELDVPADYRAVVARALARALAVSGRARDAAMLIGAEGVWYEAKMPRPVFARQRLSLALYAHLRLMLDEPGDAEEAEAAARQAHALTTERPNLEAEAMACRVLGRIAWRGGDLSAAAVAFEAELNALSGMKPRDDHEIGITLHNLADLFRQMGQNERAIANYRRALTHKDAARDRRSVALTRLALFDLLLRTGRNAEALEAGQVAVELLLQRAEADPPDLHLLGHAMSRQAHAQANFGRAQRGSAMLDAWIERLAARIREGIDHPHTGLQTLAIGLRLKGQPPISPDPVPVIDLAERALTLAEESHPAALPAWAARRDLGEIYLRLARWHDAADVLAPLRTIEAAPGSEESFVRLAVRLGMARALVQLGDMDSALTEFEAALIDEPEPHTRGLILREAAEACRAVGDDTRAAALYARALELLRRERDLPVFIDTLVALAYARLRLRQFGEAIDTFQEAVQVVERSNRPDAALLASALFDMATAHATLGQYRSAAERFRQSLTHQDMRAAPERYADTLIGLARSAAASESYQASIAAYHESLQFEHIPPDLRRALLCEQAATYALADRPQAAIDSYLEALAIEGGTAAERSTIHRSLGALYTGLKNHARARAHFEAVLTIAQDERTGLTLQALGDSYRAQAAHKEAIDAYTRAAAFLDRKREAQALAAVQRALGEIYLERNQFANALNHLEQSLDIERALPQQDGGHIVHLLQNMARAHEARGEYERAAVRHHEALVYQDARHAPDAYIETLQTLARLYMELKRYGEAAKACEEALRVEGKQEPASNPARRAALTFALGQARHGQGQLEVAAELFRTAAGPVSPVHDEARRALDSVEAEIAQHVQTLRTADQSWVLLGRAKSADARGLMFIRALQAQTCAALGRLSETEQRLAEMFALLADHPDSAEGDEVLAHLLAGWQHESAGESEAAQTEYRAALQAAEREPRSNQAFVWAIRRKAG